MAIRTDYLKGAAVPDAARAPQTVTVPAVAAADSVEIENLRLAHPHVFIGVRLFDSSGDPLDAAVTGSFVVSVQTWNTGRWESPVVDTLDATNLQTTDVQGTITGVKVEPGGLDASVVSYEVRVSAHRS